jgi:hypothetical protein
MTNSVSQRRSFTGACAFFVDPDSVGHRVDGSGEVQSVLTTTGAGAGPCTTSSTTRDTDPSEWSTTFRTVPLAGWQRSWRTLEAERMAARQGDTVVHRLVTDAAVCVHEEGGRVDDR